MTVFVTLTSNTNERNTVRPTLWCGLLWVWGKHLTDLVHSRSVGSAVRAASPTYFCNPLPTEWAPHMPSEKVLPVEMRDPPSRQAFLHLETFKYLVLAGNVWDAGPYWRAAHGSPLKPRQAPPLTDKHCGATTFTTTWGPTLPFC
ncbi:hypothetical protein E2C01_035049 [Portunus trituberculatus]|uniref:Uncharacterized protein n=1 Tax=Portunus trituberculatus TaxID=210409 RepID=A0A5B7F7E2_PORTR|nr:hypothetical protein [Portunus trituberculatus]